MKHAIIALCFISVAAVTSLAADKPADKPAAPTPHNPNEVVARVDAAEIKRVELDGAVRGVIMQMAQRGRSFPQEQVALLERDMIEQLIGRQLLLQEGLKLKIEGLDNKVQEQVKTTKTKIGGDEAFAAALKQADTTEAEFIQRTRDSIIINEVVEQTIDANIKVTPEQVKEFYDKNPDKFDQPELVKASHILIRFPAEATDEQKKGKLAVIEKVRVRLEKGEKFADVAKEVSEDPGSAVNGGNLDYFKRGTMVPEFDKVAFSLKTNEVSEIITTKFGYHILMVTDIKPAGKLPFDGVKDDIEKYLKSSQAGEVMQKNVKELRAAAKVEVLLPEITPPPVADPKADKPAPAKSE